jgi:hypothetical protein
VNYGNLEIEITVDDPKACAKPWTVTVKQRTMSTVRGLFAGGLAAAIAVSVLDHPASGQQAAAPG